MIDVTTTRRFRIALAAWLCWVAYAVGANAWEASTQLLADLADTEGVLIAIFGGAVVSALLWLAFLVARGRIY
jgi:hypothetical protein